MPPEHCYMVMNSPTDIHLFTHREHILPSVKISFSAFPGTKFEILPFTGMDVHVKVTRAGEMITETIIAKCMPIWQEPCHL